MNIERLSTVEFIDCSFIGNYAGNGGGAIVSETTPNSDLFFNYCLFDGNSSGGEVVPISWTDRRPS